jgi:hypothetical protein
MLGRRRAFFFLVLAVFTAGCGARSLTSRNASEHHALPRTDPEVTSKIGDAAVLERGTTTVPAANATSRVVDGMTLVLQAEQGTAFPKDTPVHLVLTVTNKTGRPIGYLATRERHFALVDQSNKTLWTDEQCRAKDGATTVPTTYTEIAPGAHITIDDHYPGTDATNCAAPAGHAYLTGGLTVCLNLAADDTCRGASDERVQATPIAVTVS